MAAARRWSVMACCRSCCLSAIMVVLVDGVVSLLLDFMRSIGSTYTCFQQRRMLSSAKIVDML
jgi:hypothetical protein